MKQIKLELPSDTPDFIDRLSEMDYDTLGRILAYITAWIGILSAAAVLIVLTVFILH